MSISTTAHQLDADKLVSILIPSLRFHDREHLQKVLHGFLEEQFYQTIMAENKQSSTRRRKSLQEIERILREGGYGVTTFCISENEEGLSAHLPHMDFFVIRRIGRGLCVSIGNNDVGSTERWEGARYVHSTISEEDLVSVFETFDEFRQACQETLEETLKQYDRQTAISKLSLPSVELIVEERLGKRNIPYELRLGSNGYICLDVHIVKEIWMRHDRITMDNLDRLVGLVPYLCKRPDCIKRDGMGFRLVHGKVL